MGGGGNTKTTSNPSPSASKKGKEPIKATPMVLDSQDGVICENRPLTENGAKTESGFVEEPPLVLATQEGPEEGDVAPMSLSAASQPIVPESPMIATSIAAPSMPVHMNKKRTRPPSPAKQTKEEPEDSDDEPLVKRPRTKAAPVPVPSSSSSNSSSGSQSRLSVFRAGSTEDTSVLRAGKQSSSSPGGGSNKSERGRIWELVKRARQPDGDEDAGRADVKGKKKLQDTIGNPGDWKEGAAALAAEERTRRLTGKKGSSMFTPLEKQWLGLKSAHPDAVLAVHVGYKYKFFAEDALVAAQVLSIVSWRDKNFLSASVPEGRIGIHTRRLVNAGYKVGIVQQTETAAVKSVGSNKSAPFTRELTAMYTKGTLLEDNLLGSESQAGGELSEGAAKQVWKGGKSFWSKKDSVKAPAAPAGGSWDALGSIGTEPSVAGSNYLAVVHGVEAQDEGLKESVGMGMVAVDLATGDIVWDAWEDNWMRAGLEAKLLELRPSEVVVSNKMDKASERVLTMLTESSDQTRIERVPSARFSAETAAETVKATFGGEGPLASILEIPEQPLIAMGVLVDYLREFSLVSALEQGSGGLRHMKEALSMRLTANTLENLEVLQSEGGEMRGSLLWLLQQTRTSGGARLLRRWVMAPLVDVSQIKQRSNAVSGLVDNTAESVLSLQELRDSLRRFPDFEKAIGRFQIGRASPNEFLVVLRALERLFALGQAIGGRNVKALTEDVSPVLGEIAEVVVDSGLEGIVSRHLDMINTQAAASNKREEIFADRETFPAVWAVRDELEAAEQELADALQDAREVTGKRNLEYKTVLSDTHLLEFSKAEAKRMVPGDWVRVGETKSMARFQSPRVVAGVKRRAIASEKLAAVAKDEWLRVQVEFVVQAHGGMRRIFRALNTLDALGALAVVGSQPGFVRAELVEDQSGVVDIVEGRHPIVEAIGTAAFVPNSVSLGDARGGKPRVAVITGPNMGGKSSLVRQTALIVLMNQIGSYVPATSARLSVFDAIFTRMGAGDNILRGASTFLVELTEASEVLSRATERSLVILDELGRGTSTHDGKAIAYATLEYMITTIKATTLFVTHYLDLGDMMISAHGADLVGNFHMAFIVEEQAAEEDERMAKVTFLFQLVEGSAQRSYGVNVARLADIPEEVLESAARKSKEFEEAGVLRSLGVLVMADEGNGEEADWGKLVGLWKRC